MKVTPEKMIEAFETLYSDSNFHDSFDLNAGVGPEDWRSPWLTMEIGTSMGHDGESLEIAFDNAEVIPNEDEKDKVANPLGSARAVIEPRYAMIFGAAMIGFALAAEKRGKK